MPLTRRITMLVGLVALSLVVGACDIVDAPPATPTTSLPCEAAPPSDASVRLSGDVVGQSIELARMWSGCVSTAVLARPSALDAALGVSFAESAPLIAWVALLSSDKRLNNS